MPAVSLAARLAALSVITLISLWGCGPSLPDEVAEARIPAQIDFNFHVKPILSDRCFACHGPDEKSREAGLRLDTEAGAYAALTEGPGHAIVPGKPGKSAVVDRILTADPGEVMPPPEAKLPPLSPQEKAILIRWIEQGAPYAPHWSFRPVQQPEVPPVQETGWVRNPIDHFVLARLEREGLSPSPEAPKEILLRRASLDLTGLPPTLEDMEAFLADEAPGAYERAVDRLLESPHYGEHMAAAWLDLARYADSHGYQDDGLRTMWPWRDWVISAFNRNLPFDDFVTWQLAGDLLPDPSREQILATGFNRNHMMSQEGGIVPEEYRVEYVADRVGTFGKAFLGLTVECARCHDHKYDPIAQQEFFQLFAFFNQVPEHGQIPYNGTPAPTLILTDAEAEATLASLHRQMATHEQAMQAPALEEAFARWDAQARPALRLPTPLVHLPLDDIQDFQYENRGRSGRRGQLRGDRDMVPETVPGRVGQAQRLLGDSHIGLPGPIGHFERNQPFTISLWVRPLKDSLTGPLFGKSGGFMNGLRGYECYLHPDGRLTAGLHHVWPANSLEIRTEARLPVGQWTQVVMAYDGSSRAAGLRLYFDGVPQAATVLADHLQRSTLYGVDGKNWAGAGDLSIGVRAEETMDQLEVDDWQVWDDWLSPVEVAALAGKADPWTLAGPEGRRAHFRWRASPAYARARDARLKLIGTENEILSAQTEVMVMAEWPGSRETYILDRGAYDAPVGDPLPPGTPTQLLPWPDSLPRNRLGLAQWLLHPDHPLFARVTVNRYWQQYFGQGLVKTSDDFGNQGELPSHPALLDWLAQHFRASGWDVKAFQKLIVTSATYRQTSFASDSLMTRDPDNQLLARGPRFRLSAEMMRDQALAASGLLVRDIGGPSVKPYQPPGLWKELATRNATVYEQDHGDSLYRRSMYTIWKRTTPPPAMINFDAAERNFCVVKRQRTNTPLQALVLLNDPQLVEASRVLAERLLATGNPEVDPVYTAFRRLTGRRPTVQEQQLLQELWESQLAYYASQPQAARDLVATGEYPRQTRLPAADVAALTITISTIMNLDAAIMRR